MKKQKIIAITGPSSSGKSSLAIELAKALNGEIISVDSRQIYKELDIGSAKPTIEEMQGIPHHLIDVTDITQDYTVADFSDDANKKIKEILQKDKTVILAGGTGLYFRVLLQDFDLPRVAPDKELRNKLDKLSNKELYSMLQEKDSLIAEKIHPNNRVKVIRALEVCITLGIPMSEAQKKKESNYETLWFGLNSENRNFIYERINKRTDIMFAQGLVDEVKHLYEKYGDNKLLLSTIGYQEIIPYLKGETDFISASELLKQNTRRYAKRQISWFKANKEMFWFDIEKETSESVKNTIIRKYNEM